VKLCGNAVGPDTAFLVIQNGLGSEAALAEAFPENEVIGTIAYIGASRPKPGFIHQQDSCNITFGLHPKGTSPKVALLLELFKKSGLDAKTTDDIVLARWRKLLWNAAYNPLSVLGEHADTWSIMHTPESEKLAETIMEEIASIAEADGHPVGRAAIDGNLKFTKGMSAYKTSMLQDLEAGRALEIDALLGEPLRIAGRHGVKTPVLKTLHALLKLRCRSARP
jgi:2-dehydropantoate 2-reductase